MFKKLVMFHTVSPAGLSMRYSQSAFAGYFPASYPGEYIVPGPSRYTAGVPLHPGKLPAQKYIIQIGKQVMKVLNGIDNIYVLWSTGMYNYCLV